MYCHCYDPSWLNEMAKVKELNENNFQDFLFRNMKKIFVYETPDYDYRNYLVSHVRITKGSEGEGKYMRQC